MSGFTGHGQNSQVRIQMLGNAPQKTPLIKPRSGGLKGKRGHAQRNHAKPRNPQKDNRTPETQQKEQPAEARVSSCNRAQSVGWQSKDQTSKPQTLNPINPVNPINPMNPMNPKQNGRTGTQSQSCTQLKAGPTNLRDPQEPGTQNCQGNLKGSKPRSCQKEGFRVEGLGLRE